MNGIRKALGFVAWATLLSPSPRAQSPTEFIRHLEAGKPQVLVAFGTSLTAGGAWVGLTKAYLQERFPGLATVYNEGASGHSSKYGLSIIHNVTRHKPDLALIEFSMNDAYYPEQNGYKEGVPPDTSRINLGIIVDSIRAANPACEIFVQTMDVPLGPHRQRRPNILAYYQVYRDLAKARGLGLIDHLPRWQSLLAYDTAAYLAWLPDSIHPNAEGSAAITLPAVLGALLGASVSLDSPSPGGEFSGGTLTLRATASGGPAGPVAFFDWKERLGVDSAAPFGIDWRPASGRHLLLAKRMDGTTPIAISGLAEILARPAAGTARPPRSRNAQVTRGPGPRPPGYWLGRRSAPRRAATSPPG